MASFNYSGSFSLAEISNNHPQTASLSAGGSATGGITSVSASTSLVAQSYQTYTVKATLNFSDGASATAQTNVTGNYGYPVSASFSFSGVSLVHANNISSITLVCTQSVTSQNLLTVGGSVTVTVNYTPTSKVSKPTISVATTSTSSSSVTVSWTASSDGIGNTLTGYILEYADSSDNSTWGSWTNYDTYGTSTRSVSATLNSVRAYRKFRVRATGSAGESFYSDWSESSAVYRYTIPSAPSDLSASPASWESGNVALSWTASSVSGASIRSYYIQYQLKEYGGSYGEWINLANTSSTNYAYNPNLSKGDSVQYRVRALSTDGYYSSYSATAAVSRPTDKPKNLTPTTGWYQTISTCAWELPPDIDLEGTVCQYRYSTDNGETFSAWNDAVGKSFDASSIFANVADGDYFCYEVRAVQQNGDTSEETLSPSIYKNTVPVAPVILAPAPASPSSPGAFWAVISVTANQDGREMTLAYSKDGSSLITISSLTVSSVFAVKLTQGGTYTFRITDVYGAYNETQKSVTVTAETYTDNAIDPGFTRIKAAHINELRSRIEQLCTLYGAIAPTWSETVIAGTTSVKHFPAHIEELREAIDAIYAVINNMGAGNVIASPSWAAALTDIKPKAAAIEEVRAAAGAI